jgi:putative protease
MFSARAAAGNSLDDIRQLCDYAHIFNVRVYIAFNTILKDDELQPAEALIHQLYAAGADALIIQDMGITQLNLPPIPLHISTQADNCTPEKIAFWQRLGFRQVVLARELTLDEIATIARQTSVRLEAFVHGALCVSYSGHCYLSAALSGRSANRGECAQYCRLPYSLTDANGKTIIAHKHLLSLNDLNLTDELESMMKSGISSFKIEGRLKDVAYVKNITAWYRKKLDAVFAQNPLFYRSSAGKSSYTFTPQAEKSFNRGFTSYFLHGRIPDITSFDTPKSIGEQVGAVKELKGNSFTLAGLKPVHNGDGLVFFNTKGELEGFRVNRVDANRIFPLKMSALRPKTTIYRNYDKSFEDILSKPSAERKLSVQIRLSDTDFGFVLSITDEMGVRAVITKPCLKEKAQNNQTENIRTQLSKLGNTPFQADEIEVCLREKWFIPSSVLGEMRRDAVEKLLQAHRIRYQREWVKKGIYARPDIEYPQKHLDYTANIANQKARDFYCSHGVATMENAFEITPQNEMPLMYTKHCLRYTLGWCPKYHHVKSPYQEPFYLTHKQIKLRLRFDCKECVMIVYAQVT